MKELKSCPFCGGEAEVRLKYRPFPAIWCECVQCAAKTEGYCPTESSPSIESFERCKDKAVEKWNNRK